MEAAKGAAQCRAVWRRYPLARDGETLDLGFARTDSRNLRQRLEGCSGILLFCCTAGRETDRRIARAKLQSPVKELLMQQVIRRIESRYVLRHNAIMGYTEYRSNHTWATPWRPVTEQVINTFTTDLQLAGLAVWDRDVKRYVHSTRVRDFNPIDDYLFRNNKWDGRDYIRELAATVPTENPEQWAEWFHTWFLAMVAQWLGRDRRYGNAVVPLLISRQGMHKSAFCRSLLPPELRTWGYTDNLSSRAS